MSESKPRCPRDWDQAYVEGRVPWDLGRAPPALEALLAAEGPLEAGTRVLVPGAGRGHDARAWARAGAEVTAVDIAPTAVAEGRALDAAAGLTLTWHVGDVLALPGAWTDGFDVVFEQTCFCALPPERRDDYVEAVATVLRPGGRFVAILWDVGEAGGPPWAVTREDVARHFGARFDLRRVDPIEPWTEVRWDELLVDAILR